MNIFLKLSVLCLLALHETKKYLILETQFLQKKSLKIFITQFSSEYLVVGQRIRGSKGQDKDEVRKKNMRLTFSTAGLACK